MHDRPWRRPGESDLAAGEERELHLRCGSLRCVLSCQGEAVWKPGKTQSYLQIVANVTKTVVSREAYSAGIGSARMTHRAAYQVVTDFLMT